jgi:hypothetical protein
MPLKQKPSMRIKRRYILVRGSRKDVEEAVLHGIGVLGWAWAKLVFVPCKKSGRVIISVTTKSLKDVLGSFELSKKELNVEKVASTLKGLGVK